MSLKTSEALASNIHVIRIREWLIILAAFLLRAQHRNLLWLGHGHGSKQQPVNHAEHRGVHADTERQRQHGNRGETGRFRQHANRVTQILNNSHGEVSFARIEL